MLTDQYGRTILPENGPRRRRGKAWRVVLAVVAVAAAGVGIYFARAAQDARPADAGLERALWSLDKSRPYLGTPAQDWAEGEAAIVLPEAVATGGLSAEQVGVALGKVKEFLVAGRVNRSVLTGGELEPLYAPLNPDLREALADQLRDPQAVPTYATRIAPGFRLLPTGPKISGTVRAEPGEAKGELVIRTQLTYAYAFDIDDPSQATGPLDVVAVTRANHEFVYRDGSRWPAGNRGIVELSGQGFSYSMSCSQQDQGLLAPTYSDRVVTTTGVDKGPQEAFDPAAPLPSESTC